MRVRRLVMLRHGQTDFNAISRMQGQLDSDLTDLGRAQAVAAAEVLAKRQPLLIVSSDLRRAYDTAARGEAIPVPFFGTRVTDPAKLIHDIVGRCRASVEQQRSVFDRSACNRTNLRLVRWPGIASRHATDWRRKL